MVDTSAVLAVLAGEHRDLETRLSEDGDLHAPHLLDVEFVHALRRLVVRGELTADRAWDAVVDLQDLAVARYPHEPLLDRMWELRENLTAYDASFIALAEALGAPLVTLDARLAQAPGHEARVELFG